MKFSPLITELIGALKRLPSIGPKSAQRLALHLLEHDREGALRLAEALTRAAQEIKRCSKCRNLTEGDICAICADEERSHKQLCVVESPGDVLAIESSSTYSGRYFVLLGRLSPLDGMGPNEIGIDLLLQRFATEEIEELIIATNPTVEGEATAHFIAEKAKGFGIQVSRIAHGVPIGGELEYVDGGTLAHAMTSRREI